jgi:hypothetical protein
MGALLADVKQLFSTFCEVLPDAVRIRIEAFGHGIICFICVQMPVVFEIGGTIKAKAAFKQ